MSDQLTDKPHRSHEELPKPVLFIGAQQTGKTRLAQICGKPDTITTNNDDDAAPSPTVGIQFSSRVVEVDPQTRRNVKIHLWDCSGAPRYETVTHSIYAGAAAFLFVFDVSDTATLTTLAEQYLPGIRSMNRKIPPRLYLVGNKCDVSELRREVSQKQAQQFADEKGFEEYFEVSGKTDPAGVLRMFDTVCRRLSGAEKTKPRFVALTGVTTAAAAPAAVASTVNKAPDSRSTDEKTDQ